MNKTELKEKKEKRKEIRQTILGLTAFIVAYSLFVWIGSLSFYW